MDAEKRTLLQRLFGPTAAELQRIEAERMLERDLARIRAEADKVILDTGILIAASARDEKREAKERKASFEVDVLARLGRIIELLEEKQ